MATPSTQSVGVQAPSADVLPLPVEPAGAAAGEAGAGQVTGGETSSSSSSDSMHTAAESSDNTSETPLGP
eukprot:15338031-Alexandrium_andersonii.AAC.1